MEFFITDDIVNRRVFMNIPDYDTQDFGKIQWFDMF
jgi:hypothetical protein